MEFGGQAFDLNPFWGGYECRGHDIEVYPELDTASVYDSPEGASPYAPCFNLTLPEEMAAFEAYLRGLTHPMG